MPRSESDWCVWDRGKLNTDKHTFIAKGSDVSFVYREGSTHQMKCDNVYTLVKQKPKILQIIFHLPALELQHVPHFTVKRS